MNLDEFYEILDIEEGQDFTYFENFADLMESDANIDADAIGGLLGSIDMTVFSELAESYFYDVTEHLPDSSVEIYGIIEAVKNNFVSLSMAAAKGEEGTISKLANEIERFREWYSLSENCIMRNDETGESKNISVRDAVTESRYSALAGIEFSFDFTDAEEYEIEEYIVNVGELS